MIKEFAKNPFFLILALIVVGGLVAFGEYRLFNSGLISGEGQEDYDSLLQEKISLEQQLSEVRAMNLQIGKELADLKAKGKTQTQKVQQLATKANDECSDLEDDKDNLESDIEDLKEEIDDLEQQISDAEDDNDDTSDLEEDLDSKNEDLDSLEEDLDEIESDLDDNDC